MTYEGYRDDVVIDSKPPCGTRSGVDPCEEDEHCYQLKNGRNYKVAGRQHILLV